MYYIVMYYIVMYYLGGGHNSEAEASSEAEEASSVSTVLVCYIL